MEHRAYIAGMDLSGTYNPKALASHLSPINRISFSCSQLQFVDLLVKNLACLLVGLLGFEDAVTESLKFVCPRVCLEVSSPWALCDH